MKRSFIMMKSFLCVIVVVLSCVQTQASECANGRCALRSRSSTKTVVTGEVYSTTTKNVVRTVAPTYNVRRCRNGKCSR